MIRRVVVLYVTLALVVAVGYVVLGFAFGDLLGFLDGAR